MANICCLQTVFTQPVLQGRRAVSTDRYLGKVEVEGMLRNQSCDWSTRFMRVILLELSLVSTNLQVLKYTCTVTGLQYKIQQYN